jgi:hypothetical protein
MRRIVLSLALVASACSGGGGAPDADEGLACATSGRGETYVVGLEHVGEGGLLDFKLMSATPAPPAFNDNTWIIQLNMMTGGVVGDPATGARITVTPFMPDHQHGTGIRATVEPLPGGQYRLAPVNMWMAGLWEVTLDATVGTVRDRVVYRFCIRA